MQIIGSYWTWLICLMDFRCTSCAKNENSPKTRATSKQLKSEAGVNPLKYDIAIKLHPKNAKVVTTWPRKSSFSYQQAEDSLRIMCHLASGPPKVGSNWLELQRSRRLDGQFEALRPD